MAWHGVAWQIKHEAASLTRQALTTRTMKSMSDSIYKIPLKVHEAEYSRDSLAKVAYARLFHWLVVQINASLLTQSETRTFIGILDIFGFEQFDVNSFEQPCINFANERLQAPSRRTAPLSRRCAAPPSHDGVVT